MVYSQTYGLAITFDYKTVNGDYQTTLPVDNY